MAVQKLVWLSAVLWLALEAWLTLDATWHSGRGVYDLRQMFHLSSWAVATLSWFKHHAWPAASLVVLLVLRQEAHRWFDVRRGRRSADRLITGWFVFVGTLLTVDWLAPDIRVRWPVSAIEATVWLATMQVISWISCLLHPASRRTFKKFLRRWPIAHWLGQVLVPRSTPLRKSGKGIGRDAKLPQTPTPKRAR